MTPAQMYGFRRFRSLTRRATHLARRANEILVQIHSRNAALGSRVRDAGPICRPNRQKTCSLRLVIADSCNSH